MKRYVEDDTAENREGSNTNREANDKKKDEKDNGTSARQTSGKMDMSVTQAGTAQQQSPAYTASHI